MDECDAPVDPNAHNPVGPAQRDYSEITGELATGKGFPTRSLFAEMTVHRVQVIIAFSISAFTTLRVVAITTITINTIENHRAVEEAATKNDKKPTFSSTNR